MLSAGTGTEARPLTGRHIAITRPPDQAPEFARQLEALGARVTVLSTIAIEPAADSARIDAVITELGSYDWIVLTSVNGVHALADRLAALGRSWSDRHRARIAVIGPATARALEEQNVSPDLVPEEYVAEGILERLGNVAGQRILLPRADIARQTLADELRVRGAEVDEVAAYSTVTQPITQAALQRVLSDDRVDAITFTSSSTVRGLVESLLARQHPQDALAGIALAAIGPITAGTLREYGLQPTLIAEEYTTAGLTSALVSYFTSVTSASEGA